MHSSSYGRATGSVRLMDRKRGPVWYAKLRLPGGHQVQKLLGVAHTGRGRPEGGALTRRMAEAGLRELLVEAERGTLAASHRSAAARTFRDACDEWLRYVEHDRQRAASTVRGYRNVVSGRLLPELGAGTPLASIATADVDGYRERLLASGRLSRRTIQQDLVLLHGILKRAKRRGWITVNPSEDAERVTVPRTGEFRVLTVEQVEACARAASASQVAALIRVAAYTGLRLGELRALRWRDVDFGAGTVHVRRNLPAGGREKRPKSDKVRSVPLIDRAAVALDGLSRRDVYAEPGDRVFISPTGGAVDGDAGRDGFYAALAAAGLGELREPPDPIVFHDLRHTFGTLAVQVWPIADVKAYMGHANIATTELYVHHVPKRDAARRFSEFVEAQVEPTPDPVGAVGVSRGVSRNARFGERPV